MYSVYSETQKGNVRVCGVTQRRGNKGQMTRRERGGGQGKVRKVGEVKSRSSRQR